MPLTDAKAKQAKPKEKPYKVFDERGMYLEVHPNGSKYWRLKYRFGGKEPRLAMGVYPEVSLKEARRRRDDARKLIADGIDPKAVKRAQKVAQAELAANSFEVVAREWCAKERHQWADSHHNRVLRALERDLFPYLGPRPIAEITAPELLQALRRVESRGRYETARRDRQIAGQVFRYAVATGRAERDPSADLKGALTVHTPRHMAAVTEPQEVGKLLLASDHYQGTPTVSAALRLSPLLFVRPGELRHMEWEEIDWEASEWRIPKEKMKQKQDHIVPLCRQALAILKELLPLKRGRYVFPSARGASRAMSENTVRVALRTMGYDNDTMTAHGFRAMARTLLDERLSYRIDLIEHQLAHAVKDALGRAYNRTSHLEARREMMQSWADYLDALREQASGGNVVAPNFRQKV